MHRLLFVALVALAAAPAAAQPGPSTAALFAQENAVWQAVADHRFDAFAAYLGRDYIGVYADGMRTAPQEVAAIHGITIARFQIDDFVVRSVDASDIVVTYRVDASGTEGGRDFAGRFNTSSYWHRNGRQWRLQLHSEAQITP